jgi:uncharacterized iron-regulated protein
MLLLLYGCATNSPPPDAAWQNQRAQQLQQLLPVDAILQGEQHDAPDHQRIHQQTVAQLLAQGRLAALALEMTNQGHSTAGLPPEASEAQVQAALQWNDKTWPWLPYAPAVMTAVRGGVPVLGANLSPTHLREAMSNTALDALLPAAAFQIQQDRIRAGHCGLLPESQMIPMTRVQIARDQTMALTLVNAAVPGKTVLLLAGSGHVNRQLGVPLHLPAGFKVKSVSLQAHQTPDADDDSAAFDQHWPAQGAPEVDYCADFAAQRAKTQPAKP